MLHNDVEMQLVFSVHKGESRTEFQNQGCQRFSNFLSWNFSEDVISWELWKPNFWDIKHTISPLTWAIFPATAWKKMHSDNAYQISDATGKAACQALQKSPDFNTWQTGV